MNTEAVRARNARKRAKLKAHKRGNSLLKNANEVVWIYEFAVKGIKNGFPLGSRDADFDSPYLPDWAMTEDYLEVDVEGDENSYFDLSSLKSDVRAYVEDVWGFNRWDVDVLLLNTYPKDQ